MQAQIRMKMHYDPQQANLAQKRYINVLPNHPYEAYRTLDQQTLIQVKKTERVPIPQIRQLILMYTLPEKLIPQLQQSDLLREKLILSNLNGQNQTLHEISQRWLMEQQRVMKLSQIFGNYISQREHLISRAVMKSKHNVHESAQKFKSSVKAIETEKNAKTSAFYSRTYNNQDKQPYRQARSQNFNTNPTSNLQKQEEDQLRNIQKEANMRTVYHIKSQSDQNNKYQSEEQDRLHGLRYLSCFQNQFQKALIFIVGGRNITNLNQQLGSSNQNYNKTFQDKLQQYYTTLHKFNQQLLQHIFDWHLDIKHNRPSDSRLDFFTERSKQIIKELEQQLYYFIPKILSNLETDREQMRNLTDFFTNNFQSYLGTYYSIKEVQMYHSKQGHVEEIIENQRQALNNHLKKNFGMMVNFKKSHQYEQLSSIAISRDKPYLKTLMEQRISALELAIAYVNYEHSNLYKQACEGNSTVGGKIRKKLQQFNHMGSKYPQIRVHLQQSCQRLLQIVNH